MMRTTATGPGLDPPMMLLVLAFAAGMAGALAMARLQHRPRHAAPADDVAIDADLVEFEGVRCRLAQGCFARLLDGRIERDDALALVLDTLAADFAEIADFPADPRAFPPGLFTAGDATLQVTRAGPRTRIVLSGAGLSVTGPPPDDTARAALDRAGVIAWREDRGGRITWISAAFADIAAFPDADAWPPVQVFSDLDRHFARLTGKPRTASARDGTRYRIDAQGAGGETLFVARAAERHETPVRSIPLPDTDTLGIAIFGPDGTLEEANAAFARMTGTDGTATLSMTLPRTMKARPTVTRRADGGTVLVLRDHTPPPVVLRREWRVPGGG